MTIYVQDQKGNAITDQKALDLIEKQSVLMDPTQVITQTKVRLRDLFREKFQDIPLQTFPNILW